MLCTFSPAAGHGGNGSLASMTGYLDATSLPAGARPAPAKLPLIDIVIPFTAEIDLAPLLSAIEEQPEDNGIAFSLRERFARLRLTQGFDELLCLSHCAAWWKA